MSTVSDLRFVTSEDEYTVIIKGRSATILKWPD